MGEGAWLVGFIALQRLAELVLANRNARGLLAEGGVEYGRGHYPFMVALHAVWLLGLAFLGHDRGINPVLLGVFVLLQAARVWVIATLGRRWTTRVIVLPGASLVTRGPYRFLKHPNYWIVAGEIAIVPLALGLPVFAAVFTVLNACVLYWRVRVENAALAGVEPGGAGSPQSLANQGQSL
jgi:methyltransferase